MWRTEDLFVYSRYNNKIKVMKIRFTNPFLFSVGLSLILGAEFLTGSILSYFLGSACFGLIFVNFLESRKNG